MRKLCVPVLLAAFLLAPCQGMGAERALTARDIFSRLPESIFECTGEGLSDRDKQELLTNGRSDTWEIIQETPDSMIFSSLPVGEKTVGLKLYRNARDDSVTIVAGTLDDDPVCAIEYWKADRYGRLVPVDGPEEPETAEFLRGGRKTPAKGMVQICLEGEKLVARPLFWNKRGMLNVPLKAKILFTWTGDGFKKEIEPLGD